MINVIIQSFSLHIYIEFNIGGTKTTSLLSMLLAVH